MQRRTSHARLAFPRLCFFHMAGNRGAFRLPGATWDRFHCTVEPLPGHTRCRKKHIDIKTCLEDPHLRTPPQKSLSGGSACDPGSHLQECSGGPGQKVPHGVLFECFWAPGSECRTECFLSVFWGFLCPRSAQKHSKSTLWGTPSQASTSTQKALRGALSGPGPLSTPVNGGRGRKVLLFLENKREGALPKKRMRAMLRSLHS